MHFKFLIAFISAFFLFTHPSFAKNEGLAAYNAGMRAYNDQEFQNAVYAFEHSIAYDPSLYKSYCMLGLSYILNDEPERGVQMYQQAIQKFPSEWNAYVLLAEFYDAQKENSEALSYYLQAENLLPAKEAKKYKKRIEELREKQKDEWSVSESEKDHIISGIYTPLDMTRWRVSLVEKKETALHVVYGLKSENYRAGKWSQILDLTCTYTKGQGPDDFNKINEWLGASYRRQETDMDTISKTDVTRLYEVNIYDKKTQILGYIFPASKGFCIAQFNYKKLSSKDKEEWINNITKINIRNF